MLRFFIIAALTVLSFSAAAQQGARDFPAIVPQDWTVLPPGRSNEWRAVSPRKDAWLSLYTTPATGSPRLHLRRWGTDAGDRVTYQRQGQTWSVVSGYTRDNRVFYRETMLACQGRKWHDLDFEYPASAKPQMNEFVDRASHALGAYGSAGC
jgi:serine/threonine-protein kinase